MSKICQGEILLLVRGGRRRLSNARVSEVTYNSLSPPNAIFAYGTLMQGESHSSLLEEAGVVSVSPASIAGELLDLGEYPALRIRPYTTNRVHGQLIEVNKLNKVLAHLDTYEGPAFRREIVHVSLDDGRSHFAWVYVLANDSGDSKVIPSGRWGRKSAGA